MHRRARLDAPGSYHQVRGFDGRRIGKDVQDRKNFFKRMGELAAGMKTTIAEVARQLGVRPQNIKNIKASESISQLSQQRPLLNRKKTTASAVTTAYDC